MNNVQLMGNLTRDPDLKYTPKGVAVCEFSIGVNRTWKADDGTKREEASFFDIVAWGRLGERIAEFLKKGRRVLVEGRLVQERWEDEATKKNRSRVKVIAERVHFIGPRTGAGAKPAEEPETVEATEEKVA